MKFINLKFADDGDMGKTEKSYKVS